MLRISEDFDDLKDKLASKGSNCSNKNQRQNTTKLVQSRKKKGKERLKVKNTKHMIKNAVQVYCFGDVVFCIIFLFLKQLCNIEGYLISLFFYCNECHDRLPMPPLQGSFWSSL